MVDFVVDLNFIPLVVVAVVVTIYVLETSGVNLLLVVVVWIIL